MADGYGFTDLPMEILEMIIFNTSLTYEDVDSLKFTCRRIYDLIHHNNVKWKLDFLRRLVSFHLIRTNISFSELRFV